MKAGASFLWAMCRVAPIHHQKRLPHRVWSGEHHYFEQAEQGLEPEFSIWQSSADAIHPSVVRAFPNSPEHRARRRRMRRTRNRIYRELDKKSHPIPQPEPGKATGTVTLGLILAHGFCVCRATGVVALFIRSS